MSDDGGNVLDALTTAIREHHGGEALVTSYVVIASFSDADGTPSIYTETAENQRCHVSLGLLSFGLAQENQRAVTGDEDG